jgi:hypothetical protein
MASGLPTYTERQLTDKGWMTIDQFLETFTYGLRDYLTTKVWGTGHGGDLHHPTDLAVNTAVYAEVAYSTIENFGVAPCDQSEN